MKHEANVILKPILNDIKKLKAGFEFFIGGKFNIFYGTQSEFSLSSGEVCATLQTSLIDTSVYTNKYLKTSSGERLWKVILTNLIERSLTTRSVIRK